MKRNFIHAAIFACALLFIPCACNNPRNLTGNDRDCHGCIGSAGYSWSVLLQKCIRPFEEGVKLSPIEEGSVNYAAYLVFNDDGSMVELFLPSLEENLILKKEPGNQGVMVWSSSEPGTPVVRKSADKYEILMEGEITYRQ